MYIHACRDNLHFLLHCNPHPCGQGGASKADNGEIKPLYCMAMSSGYGIMLGLLLKKATAWTDKTPKNTLHCGQVFNNSVSMAFACFLNWSRLLRSMNLVSDI